MSSSTPSAPEPSTPAESAIPEPEATAPASPTDAELTAALGSWLPEQRWFSAKGHTVTGVDVLTRETLATTADLTLVHLLVEVHLEGADSQVFQVPVGVRAEVDEDLEPAVLLRTDGAGGQGGARSGCVVYDGLRDPSVIGLLSDLLATGGTGDVRFLAVPGADLPTGLSGRVLGAEQSNTSVVVGDRFLLKLFRRVAVGVNPDVELHQALGRAESAHVATLRGWIEADVRHDETTLGMMQDFVAGASEGWTAALEAVDAVLAAGDLGAGDFTGEARSLGGAVASVHRDLARVLGTSIAPAAETTAAISARVESALPVVEGLDAALPCVRALIEAAGESAVDTQRIHGDLHLGQVLRTPDLWVLIDFEGEPSRSVDERRTPDSPLRDVAGMVRSVDYAAMSRVVDLPDDAERVAAERLAREWVDRTVTAFLDGYAEEAGRDPRENLALLRAYELDKAVYEAVYEARNRPGWLSIPMHAIERLADG